MEATAFARDWRSPCLICWFARGGFNRRVLLAYFRVVHGSMLFSCMMIVTTWVFFMIWPFFFLFFLCIVSFRAGTGHQNATPKRFTFHMGSILYTETFLRKLHYKEKKIIAKSCLLLFHLCEQRSNLTKKKNDQFRFSFPRKTNSYFLNMLPWIPENNPQLLAL